jgi:hypothetical protein
MQNKIFIFLVPFLSFFAGVMFLTIVFQTHSNQQQNANVEINVANESQCAHWVMFRAAQLLGIPTAEGEMQRRLPFDPKGHSLLQITETLSQIGIKASGHRDNWETLTKVSFPCIAHLKNPDHYIVISGIEPEQGYVHIFDFDGQRTRQRREIFEKRWTGYTLYIEKDQSFFNSQNNDSVPRAVFDHLILDKGDIPALGEPIEFVFPIYNTGTTNLVVEDVQVNCGCLKSEKPEHPIPPGGNDVVKLFYSIEPKRGVFMQTAAVKTNDPNNPIVAISVYGFTGVDVRMEPANIYLDKLFTGRDCTYHCIVRYTGEWNDFKVDIEADSLNGVKLLRHDRITLDNDKFSSAISVSNAKTKISEREIRNNRIFEFVFEPTGKLHDKVNGTIVLKTNVTNYEKFTLNVHGIIKSPVQAFPTIVDLQDETEKTIVLHSKIQEPFQVIEAKGKDVTCQLDTNQFQDEHKLSLKKSGNHPTSLNVKYKFRNDPVTFDLTIDIFK